MIPPEEIRAKLDQIKGHLVWMPLEFLKDASMAETGLQVNQFTESYVVSSFALLFPSLRDVYWLVANVTLCVGFILKDTQLLLQRMT
jgi:hypothetical protein